MQVSIASSSKFYDTARRLALDLTSRGVHVHTPRFDYDERFVDVEPDDKHKLTKVFLKTLRRSRALYVVAEGGYTGCSTQIEMGFAYAMKIPIHASERPTEAAAAALLTSVVAIDRAAGFLESGPHVLTMRS